MLQPTNLLIVFTTVLIAIYVYFKFFVYNYWLNIGAPFLPPTFPLGNSPGIFTKNANFGMETADFYKKVKKLGYKFAGIWTVSRPVLVVVDPDYIRDILTKDFNHFVDRGFYHNEKNDPITAHLFAMDDVKWKNMRNKLTPTFTSGKMKMMFESVLQCSDYMIDAIGKMAENESPINIKEFLACFTTDVIGTCAFGIECNSFKEPDAEFRRMGQKIFEMGGVVRLLKVLFVSKFPNWGLKLGLGTSRPDVSKFFFETVETTVRYREENNVTRPDFLQLLIDLKNRTKDSENPFTLRQLVPQVFVFFIAGFDTSSTAMTFALYELAQNQECQDKVRKEILEVLERYEGQITYESLKEMTYLQQVIDEALRMYSPLMNLTRKCVKDYKLRDTDIIIEKGTPIVIPISALHRDPDHFPDPDKFDPERFSAENKITRHPYVHLPFGEGPRNCIGLRFGLMQSKIGLTRILKQFRVRVSPTTDMPIRFDPNIFLLTSINTFYMEAEKL